MADYPDLIYLDPDTETELKLYLDTELERHRMERGKFQDDLEQMQHSYWAEPTDEIVTFPFNGASNIVIPLNAIAIEATHARAMTTVFGIEQLISAKAIAPDWVSAQSPLENFLNKELKNNVKVRTPINDCFLEIEKFGTGILKSGYVKIVKNAMRTVGNRTQSFPVTVREGATLDCVPVSRFLMPYSNTDEQIAAWCGEEHSRTPHEILLHEQAKLFYPGTYEAIKRYVLNQANANMSDFERSQADLDRHEMVMPDRIDFYEIWLSWNTDREENNFGDGTPKNTLKEIVLHYHRDSRTIMSIRYNWYEDLHRPYRKGVFFPIEHRWYGLGLIKQNNQFQEEITTRHRQMLDNATLANMRMIKVSKQSGYGPNEPVFPGKIWFLDDMTHLETLQMGEIYPSSYNAEQSTLQYSQQRSGINELTLGQPAVGTPGTASDILARIQEGNKKFGFVFENMKQPVNEAFLDIVSNIKQFGPKDIEYYTYAEGGDLVQQFFKMPDSLVRNGILIELSAAGQMNNKLIDRQNWQQIGQVYQQYVEGNLQLLQQNPQLAQQFVQKAIAGSSEIMRQILESFDVRNIDRILLNDRVLIASGASGNPQNGGDASVGGNPQIAPAPSGNVQPLPVGFQ